MKAHLKLWLERRPERCTKLCAKRRPCSPQRAAAALVALALLGVGPARAAESEGLGALSAAAVAKIDPRILLVKALPREDGLLRHAGDRVAMMGESAADLTFPVVLKTTLTDAELAGLGAAPDTRTGDLVTARVRDRDLDRLASHPGVISVEGAYFLHSTLDISTVETGATLVNQPGTGLTGDGVLYGLIDDGIDITHEDFQDAQGGSRILFIWDHFTPGNGNGTGFTYGREFTKAQIDNGQASSFTNKGGHGSHVAGISVGDGSDGNSPYKGIAYEANILAVRNGGCDLFCYGGGTPPFGLQSTVGAIDGLTYLKSKANALGRPLVVNQSQGVTMGPHDGTTLFEAAYDNIIQTENVIVAVAAGNDQDANWHGSAFVTSGGTGTFTAVHDDSGEAGGPLPIISFELWYDTLKQFSYTLTNPSGQTVNIPVDFIPGVEPSFIFASQQDSVWVYSASSHPVNGQGNLNAFLVNRTLGLEGGLWEVEVVSQGGSSGTVHFYGERNQFNFTVLDPDLTGIVAMPGTANHVITVGSYNTRASWPTVGGTGNAPDGNPLGDITTFSSHGPRRDGAQKPDLGAPGKWIVSTFSNQSTSQPIFVSPDGKHVAFQGTSMACPHVAGAIALMLEKDPSLSFSEVKDILQTTARHDAFTGQGWQPDFGHGKLDVAAAVNAVSGGSNCSTASGDANLNGIVNVLDVVATVNHIIGQSTLSGEEQACADVTRDEAITVNDVNGIVNIILGGVPVAQENGAPLAQEDGTPALARDAEPREIAWGEAFEETSYRLLLDPVHVGGIQLSYMLPRGYEPAGDPVLHGSTTASLSWSEALRQYTLLVYDTSGQGLAAGSSPLVLEVPVTHTWDGGQDMSAFAVTRFVLSDPAGRTLVPAPEPSLEPAPGEAGGVQAHLTSMTPNPMQRITQIKYQLDAQGPVRVDVYDAEGRHVRNLWTGTQMAGPHSLPWDGRDDEGAAVSTGVYFVRLDTGRGGDGEKILVVR